MRLHEQKIKKRSELSEMSETSESSQTLVLKEEILDMDEEMLYDVSN